MCRFDYLFYTVHGIFLIIILYLESVLAYKQMQDKKSIQKLFVTQSNEIRKNIR